MKPHERRDVLFGAGCALVLIGLFPYLQQLQISSSIARSDSSDQCYPELRQQQFIHPSTNTAFDLLTCFVSVAFALFGSGAMMLSLVLLPPRSLRVCVRVLGVPMAVLSAQSVLLAGSIYSADEVAQAWQDAALHSFGTEQLARQVNDIYCHALINQRRCSDRGLVQSADLLTASTATSQWCADYATSDTPSDAPRDRRSVLVEAGSPYAQHCREVLRDWTNSPIALAKSARLLLVLATASFPALLVLAQWIQANSKGDPTGTAAAVPAAALSVPDKIKLLTSDSLAAYPSGLVQPFSRQEIARLKKRFATMLPAEATSLLPIQSFLLMPELRLNPLLPLVAASVLRKSEDSDISYSLFLTILAIFSSKQSLEGKRKVLFDVYDADSDGLVSLDDVVAVLAKIVSESPTKLRPAVEARLAPLFTSSQDNYVGFDAFAQLFPDEEVWSALTIAY